MIKKINSFCAVFFVLIFFHNISLAQKTNTISATITGSAVVSTDGKSVFFNMGGPGIRVAKKDWMASINLLPSLRFFEDQPRPFVTPILGTGVFIGYKRFIVAVPLYYLSARSEWIVTAGIGVKLGR